MSFSTSLSGLNANQQKLNVIGNNLANINTIGFKSSTVTFSDLVSQSVGGSSVNPMQVGLGVTVGSISPNFGQGGTDNTGVPTNAAIQGSGFFVIGNAANRTYTRAGDFSFSANGTLVTSDGQSVQGYTALTAAGAVITTGQPTNIVVPPGVMRAPTPTTQFGITSNLDAGAVSAATFTASSQIYDALGTGHVATITYTKSAAAGAWTYAISVPGADVNPVTANPFVAKSGTLTFSGAGVLTTVDGAAPAAAGVVVTSPTWLNGATATNFTWNVLSASGSPLLTGYAAPSATSSATQNGAAPGTVSGVSIDGAGQIVATLGAGQTVVVGQLALANFNNPQGLVKIGTNRFGESAAAGVASVGVAGTGGRGSLIGGAIEGSNVDMAQEFTQMILAQRGYQANSKSITTADQILMDTLNLKQ
jgi:flagellar hook protein FlgE